MIGTMVGHYKVEEKLGEGGMGIVYKATDTKLDRLVALKFLPPNPGSDDHERQRFVNEAKAASALDHPNICTIHGVEESQDGRLYIAMAYYDGQSLEKRIPDTGLPITDAVTYAIHIAEGIYAAHKKGVIHRDIKSSNIMVTSEGQIKIMDFGLAKSTATSLLTKTGAAVGTVPCMSPEQARGERVDRRTDIWSLGVVLYHMIAGRMPFEGAYSQALLYLILNEDPPPISSLRSDIPGDLEHIITKCLTKDPDLRYQDTSDVLADLHRLAGAPIKIGLTWTRVWRKVRNPTAAGVFVVATVLTISLFFGPRFFPAEDRVIDSIAVLPLENLSGDPGQDYLAAGLHEALITDLATLKGLHRVIARSSVRRFENSTLSPRQIASELGVQALLTGSVLRSGDRVQVTAHLIDASSEDRMWSERFEREYSDLLTMQNEIVETLAKEISLQLSPQERARLGSPVSVNPEAYEAYLQGRFHWFKQTRDGFEKAERYYHLALQKDPNYALAYAGLASVWMMRGDTGFEPPSETFPRGRALFAKALELDTTSAEIYSALANQKAALDWDWAGSEAAFKRAIEINPNLADARFFYADLLATLGRTEEWENEIGPALELDPLNDFKKSFYGWQLNYAGRYDEAIPLFKALLLTGPNKASNYLGLWGAYYKKGKYDEALTAAKEYYLMIGDREFADALGSGSEEPAYRSAMLRTGNLMARRSSEKHVPAIRIARMFAHAGETDSAIRWLETAYQARESPMARLGVFWDWDGLRSDPRFRDILARMNLAVR